MLHVLTFVRREDMEKKEGPRQTPAAYVPTSTNEVSLDSAQGRQ
jgi:hypothetical protein